MYLIHFVYLYLDTEALTRPISDPELDNHLPNRRLMLQLHCPINH